MKVTRIARTETTTMTTIGAGRMTRTASCSAGISPVLPNNHGPQTDRLVYGLGPFQGYRLGDPTSREAGSLRSAVRRHVHPHPLERRTDHRRPVRRSLSARREGDLRPGQPEPRRSRRHSGRAPATGQGRVHRLQPLLDRARSADERHLPERHPAQRRAQAELHRQPAPRVVEHHAAGKRRRSIRSNIITGLKGSGDWVQVGRNALPLFNAGLVGTQRQTLYLHTSPLHDVTNFGADILFPVLVRDAEALGIYAALGVPPATVATLKGPRVDIINAINLGRPIPIADGFTGDVITLDAAIDSSFPNGRRLGGGTAPNRNQVNVNSVLISLIVAGNPGCRPGQRRRGQRQGLSSIGSRSWRLLIRVCSRDTAASTCRPCRTSRFRSPSRCAFGRSARVAEPSARFRSEIRHAHETRHDFDGHTMSASTFRRSRDWSSTGHRPAGRAARRARHVDRADDVLSGVWPDRQRAVARRAGPARRSAAARPVARQSVRRRGRRRPQAGRRPRRRAIRPASCASPRPACSSSAIAATRAPIELPADKFNQYLKEEGLDAVAALRARRNETGAGARDLLTLREEPGALGSAGRGAGRSAARLHARARRRTQSVRACAPVRIFRFA